MGACAAEQNVANPNTITLRKALVDTVDAINAGHEEAQRNGHFYGFYACKLTAVFAISAQDVNGRSISLNASSPASVVPISIGGTAAATDTATGARSNTVTVEFDTPDCMPNAKPSGASGHGPVAFNTGVHKNSKKPPSKKPKPCKENTSSGPHMNEPPFADEKTGKPIQLPAERPAITQ